jgi:hypothetical protein
MFKPPEEKTQEIEPIAPSKTCQRQQQKNGVKVWRRAPAIDEPIG